MQAPAKAAMACDSLSHSNCKGLNACFNLFSRDTWQ